MDLDISAIISAAKASNSKPRSAHTPRSARHGSLTSRKTQQQEAVYLLAKAVAGVASEGTFQAVHPLLSRALSLHEQAFGKEHEATLVVLMRTASFYIKHDKVTQAEYILQRLALRHDRHLDHHHWEDEYNIALSLSTLQTVMGDYQQASELAERALESLGKAKEGSSKAATLACLGHARMGVASKWMDETEKGRECLEKALQCSRTAKDGLLLSHCLIDLACHHRENDRQQCESLLRQAVAVAEGQDPPLQLPLAIALTSLGASLDDVPTAIENTLKALSLYRSSGASNNATTPRRGNAPEALLLPLPNAIPSSPEPGSSQSILVRLLSSPNLYPSLAPTLLVTLDAAVPINHGRPAGCDRPTAPSTPRSFQSNRQTQQRPGSGWGTRGRDAPGGMTPRGSSAGGGSVSSGNYSSVWYRLGCHLHFNLGHLYAQAGESKASKHLTKAMSMLRTLWPPHPRQEELFRAINLTLGGDPSPRSSLAFQPSPPSPLGRDAPPISSRNSSGRPASLAISPSSSASGSRPSSRSSSKSSKSRPSSKGKSSSTSSSSSSSASSGPELAPLSSGPLERLKQRRKDRDN